MSKLKTVINIIKKGNLRNLKMAFMQNFSRTRISRLLPDKIYLNMYYKASFGRKIDFKNPKTFNEKLQWLKIYNRNPEYTKLVDKYEVKKYIAEKIGEEYVIPTLGIWDRIEDIDFDLLPEQFVLKCTHDSGSVVICKDKKDFDFETAKAKLTQKMKSNLFWFMREWPYKNIKKRIIAEAFLEDENSVELKDYKIHVFDGKAEFILVCDGRFSEEGLTEDFYDTDWNHMPIKRPRIPNKSELHKAPELLEKMLELAEFLAKDFPFARVDFYIIQNKIYFGEITFFPAAGISGFEPEEWDYKFGSLITLPGKR